MTFEDFDLEKFQKETGYEFKIAYDVFSAYYFHMFESEDKLENIKDVSIKDINQVVDWVTKYAIPFYEGLEEFEMCSRLIKVNSFLLSQIKK